MKYVITIVVIVLLALFVGGCTRVTYNPKSGAIDYVRMGDQELNGLYAAIDPNGAVHVEIEKQQSGAEALGKMVDLIMVLATRGLVPVAPTP